MSDHPKQPPFPHGPLGRQPLGALLEAVCAARAELQACRAARPGPETEWKRQELVQALNAYVDGLEAWQLPVPRTLHSELLLHEGLLRRPH